MLNTLIVNFEKNHLTKIVKIYLYIIEFLVNMMMIRKNVIFIIEAIDIFSYPCSFLFTFKGKFHYSTVSTKIMTIFIFSLSLLSLFYFGRNVLSKTNPQCILNEIYDADPEAVYMDANSFFFTFSMENNSNSYKPFIDESIYKVAVFSEKRINETLTYSAINMIRCDESHLPTNNEDVKNYFIKNHYQDFYFQNYSEVLMEGTWDSDVFTDIQILIRPCDNYTDNNTCQSPDVIKSKIEGGNFVMHYTSFQTDLNNYDAPLKIAAVDDFEPTTLQSTTQIYYSFSKVQVQTDVGVFTENFIYHEGVNLDSSKVNFYQYTNNDSFLNLYLRFDSNVKITTRKYDNILDILSKVGGLLRILTVFGFLFLRPFLSDALLQRISNEAFDYEECLNEIDAEKPQNKLQNKKTKTRKLKLSFWEFLKSKFRKKLDLNMKSRIMHRSVKIMKTNMDISLLMKRLFEIEKLKLMFRNKEEFELLNNQKPKIIWDEEKFEKIRFKSEFEKVFQRNFCIHQDTKIFQKDITGEKKLSIPKENKNNESPITLNVDHNNEDKKENIMNEEFSIELAQNSGKLLFDKKENEKFNDFERKISEIRDENPEKEVNGSNFNRKNMTSEIFNLAKKI